MKCGGGWKAGRTATAGRSSPRNAFGERSDSVEFSGSVDGILLGTGSTDSDTRRQRWGEVVRTGAGLRRGGACVTLAYDLQVPSYFFTEAASVLQRKVAVDRTLSEADGLAALQILRAHSDDYPRDRGSTGIRLRHGVRYRRPVYDSFYLMLAISVGGRVVTADRRLYNGVHGGPLDHLVLWVTDPL